MSIALGASMIAFGSTYPHFLREGSFFVYVVAAPLGIIPCPSLSVAVGFALLAGGFGARAWPLALAATGLFYGLFGAVRLGVLLDLPLVAGSFALVIVSIAANDVRRSAKSGDPGEDVRRRDEAYDRPVTRADRRPVEVIGDEQLRHLRDRVAIRNAQHGPAHHVTYALFGTVHVESVGQPGCSAFFLGFSTRIVVLHHQVGERDDSAAASLRIGYRDAAQSTFEHQLSQGIDAQLRSNGNRRRRHDPPDGRDRCLGRTPCSDGRAPTRARRLLRSCLRHRHVSLPPLEMSNRDASGRARIS
jgi:hypothetical protein